MKNQIINIDPDYKYGTLIELLPIKKDDLPSGHRPEWYGKYIYPTTLKSTMKEKLDWSEYMRNNWKIIYPEYATEYKFGRILYWHLPKSHCLLIKRNREWFKEKYPKFKEFWDQVLELRNDPIKKQQLIEEIAQKEVIRCNKINKKIEKIQVPVKQVSYAEMFDSD